MLLRRNEINNNHPNHTELVLALRDALDHYMRRHTLASSIPPPAMALVEEEAAPHVGYAAPSAYQNAEYALGVAANWDLEDIANDDTSRQSISDHPSVADDTGDTIADEANEESAPASPIPGSVSQNSEPSTALVLSGAVDLTSDLGALGSGLVFAVAAEQLDAAPFATTNDPQSLLPRTSGGSEALSWIYTHYSRDSDPNNRDLSLIRGKYLTYPRSLRAAYAYIASSCSSSSRPSGFSTG